eukprot:SAG11_NODE_116_length_16002_cov_19.164560_10_plen_84_part_00
MLAVSKTIGTLFAHACIYFDLVIARTTEKPAAMSKASPHSAGMLGGGSASATSFGGMTGNLRPLPASVSPHPPIVTSSSAEVG